MLDRRGRIETKYAAIYARLETIVSRADENIDVLPEKLKLIGPPAPLLKRSKRRIKAGVRAYIADIASALYTLNAELNSLSSIAIFLSPLSVGLALSSGKITATEFMRFLNSA